MYTGKVGIVTKNPGWYGRIIQIVTNSPAYHTVWADSEDTVISAETPKVIRRPIDYFGEITWTTEEPDPTKLHDAVRFMNDQVGHGYAYFDIFLLLIAHFTRRRTPDPIIDHLMSTRRWFCSELCDAGLIASGINIFPGQPACTVIPADFYAHTQEHANNPEG